MKHIYGVLHLDHLCVGVCGVVRSEENHACVSVKCGIYGGNAGESGACFQEADIQDAPVDQCYLSGNGLLLQSETMYVPWNMCYKKDTKPWRRENLLW